VSSCFSSSKQEKPTALSLISIPLQWDTAPSQGRLGGVPLWGVSKRAHPGQLPAPHDWRVASPSHRLGEMSAGKTMGTTLVGLEVLGQKICHFPEGIEGRAPYLEGDRGLVASSVHFGPRPLGAEVGHWGAVLARRPGRDPPTAPSQLALPAVRLGSEGLLSCPCECGDQGSAWALGFPLIPTISPLLHAITHSHTHTCVLSNMHSPAHSHTRTHTHTQSISSHTCTHSTQRLINVCALYTWHTCMSPVGPQMSSWE
jgi:hypothetical protein